MMVRWFAALLLASTASFVFADVPSAGRIYHDCVHLRFRIYCYGGVTRDAAKNIASPADNLTFYLDLSMDSNLTDLQTAWISISENVGRRDSFAMAALPELNSFIIDGGELGSLSDDPVTAIFNASTGVWDRDVATTQRTLLNTHTAISGANNMIYMAGGISDQRPGNVTFPEKMSVLNLAVKTWNDVASDLQIFTSQTRFQSKAALGQDQRTIYYVGGMYPYERNTLGGFSYRSANMSDILTFDTVDSTWKTETTVTEVVPFPRIRHTLTLIPSSGELVLYGGVQAYSENPLVDYFYILNTDTLTWRTQSLGTSREAQGAGARYGHAGNLRVVAI
ncbi:hypothetical protein BJV82DRAFT_597095 [Fennellomyces sp. T-0311]|nr:hypothetical protein BJV82DRAFT_597095 [Fennellomyces sp. T-0311]